MIAKSGTISFVELSGSVSENDSMVDVVVFLGDRHYLHPNPKLPKPLGCNTIHAGALRADVEHHSSNISDKGSIIHMSDVPSSVDYTLGLRDSSMPQRP